MLLKTRFAAFFLAFALLLALPVQAAGGSLKPSKTYTGQFSDLKPNSVFYDNVSALYAYGLSLGKPDGTFGVQDPLTTGQVIIFAGRLRSLWDKGDPEAGAAPFRKNTSSAALPYLRYLQSVGALDQALNSRLPLPATRAEVAHVLAHTLPEGALPRIYDDLVTEGFATRRILTDVTTYTPYYQDILWLYRCGISAGCDEKGSYCPGDTITRGAAAAMITRMADPALRVRPDWPPAPTITMADLVTPATPVTAPATLEQMDQSVRAMLASGKNQMKLKYNTLSEVQARKILTLALKAVKSYCEQSYNSVSCRYTPEGELWLSFGSTAADSATLERYRRESLDKALSVKQRLHDTGRITADMSQTDKALAYYQWICDSCVYDERAKDDSLSHLPWGLFHWGKAVCDGYTGAYNLLLKLEGIECSALSNEDHIWTVAELDGRTVHIDPTWGDQQGWTDLRFFAMTPQQSWKHHPW